jgi:hypothetical protein
MLRAMWRALNDEKRQEPWQICSLNAGCTRNLPAASRIEHTLGKVSHWISAANQEHEQGRAQECERSNQPPRRMGARSASPEVMLRYW